MTNIQLVGNPESIVSRQDIADMLSDSQNLLNRTRLNIRSVISHGIMPGDLIIRLQELERRQLQLSSALDSEYNSCNLGIIGIIGIGVGAALAALGGWVWKQREEAKKVENQSDFYTQMVEDGVDPGKAASILLGEGSPLMDMIKAGCIAVVLITGAYLVFKFVK